jgi:hypothetical protein
MSARTLIAIGIAWVSVVVLWLRFNQDFVFAAWRPKGIAKQTGLLGAIYALILLYQVFLVGWIVPLSLGAYRLALGLILHRRSIQPRLAPCATLF